MQAFLIIVPLQLFGQEKNPNERREDDLLCIISDSLKARTTTTEKKTIIKKVQVFQMILDADQAATNIQYINTFMLFLIPSSPGITSCAILWCIVETAH